MNVLWIGYGKMGERMCDCVATGHSVKVLDSGAAQRSAARFAPEIAGAEVESLYDRILG